MTVISRRLLACTAALMLPVLGLSAQGTRWVCPDGFAGQELRIWNWSTYIAETTIPDFEDACDVTVEYDVFSNNEDVIAALRAGEADYDLIVPSDYIIGIMIDEGLLRPLNRTNIPNMVNIAQSLRDPSYDPENAHSVPYQWGTIGIGYVPGRTGEISTWQQLFDYEGPVAWLNDLRIMMGAALLVLGYDPNSSDPAEVEAARDFLIANSANVIAVAEDDGQALLAGGYVDMAVEYSGDIFQLAMDCMCEDFVYLIPEEGSLLWTDNMVIPATAENPELAEVFIDYVLDPQVGADISNFIAYASPNEGAIERGLIDRAMLINTSIYPPPSVRERLFINDRSAEVQALYEAAWAEVLEAVGA
jgi:spermidine/putrescine transport system substrate-binding protein